ncbi:hypothetical protein VUR80DRAFT_9189 [Thermomyces stellatus]
MILSPVIGRLIIPRAPMVPPAPALLLAFVDDRVGRQRREAHARQASVCQSPRALFLAPWFVVVLSIGLVPKCAFFGLSFPRLGAGSRGSPRIVSYHLNARP